MELLLAKDEKIIKSYLYSNRSQKGLGGGKYSLDKKLIITNKRVISESKSKVTVIRKEVPLSACDYISSSYAKQSRSIVGTIVCIVLALIGFVAYFIIKENMYKLIALGVGAFFIILALILFILFLLKKNAYVELEIGGKKRENNLLSVGSSNMVLNNKKKNKTIKIVVDRKISEAMINEIGALLLNTKAGIFGGDFENQNNEPEHEDHESLDKQPEKFIIPDSNSHEETNEEIKQHEEEFEPEEPLMYEKYNEEDIEDLEKLEPQDEVLDEEDIEKEDYNYQEESHYNEYEYQEKDNNGQRNDDEDSNDNKYEA